MHDQHCDCGCEHEHHHEHHHDQHHDEHCDCGCEHEHHHDEHCDCGCEHEQHTHQQAELDSPAITVQTIDGATVGSCQILITGKTTQEAEELILAALKHISNVIENEGGIVGHAKALVETPSISKISVIDAQSTIDRAEGQTHTCEIAIIAFVVTEQRMSELLQEAF